MRKHIDHVRRDVHAFFRHPTASQLLIQWLALLILFGTVLLALPFSHGNRTVGFIDAFFTATSAVCVTGLITVDTGTAYSTAGQWIILLLIQLGGIGILTFLAIAFHAFGMRMKLQSQIAVEDSIFQRGVASQFRLKFFRILRVVLGIEAAGALFLFLSLAGSRPMGHSLYSSVFHSVSAFCNAGFSIYTDNLEGVRGNPLFMLTIMLLVFSGGIGFEVLGELAFLVRSRLPRRRINAFSHQHRLSLHARVALGVSLGLIAAGALLIGFAGTGENSSLKGRMFNALFQSVSSRTAGFNSVNIGSMPLASLFVLVVLMFIGGSPGSCAGGIKTTTLAVWWARFRATFRGDFRATLLQRYIPEEIGRKVTMLIGLSLCWNILGVLVLAFSESASLEAILFEQVSAFGTVGLSTGLTPELSAAGKLWIILTMFVGRVGPITIAMSAVDASRANIHYPEGRVMIG